MRHTTTPTHTVYAEIPMERLARAHCYRCGTEAWAEHMIWLAHPMLQGHLALCGSCYGDYHGDVALLLAVHPPTEHDARSDWAKAIP